MGYDNTFSLKIAGEMTKPVMFCKTCNEERIGNFCADCGTKLVVEQVPFKCEEIIKQLRQESEDCYVALKDSGKANEGCSGYDVENDIQKFSKKFPELVFRLDIDWDSGFSDGDGDPKCSRFYFKNGKKQNVKAKITYDEPKF